MEDLREELAELRAEVARMREILGCGASDEDKAQESDSALDRRSLLGRTALVAAGGLGAALAGNAPAQAAPGDPWVLGEQNSAGGEQTALTSTSEWPALAIVNNRTDTHQNVGGAIYAVGETGTAVYAASHLGYAIRATTVRPENDFNAVFARSSGGGSAVFGLQDNTASHTQGVYGKTVGTGNGVYGESTGTGTGVCGEAVSGVGVLGVSRTGRGGVFRSVERSQVRLVPSTAPTHPATGAAGDLFLDASKRLWLCRGATSWVQVA